MASHRENRGRHRGGYGGHRGGRPHHNPPPVSLKKHQAAVNENSPIIKAFREYQTELDTRHDRYERVVKLSRDITIESKRAIFLLHRCTGEEASEKQSVLKQTGVKLKEIQKTKWLNVALELDGQDHYQFIRAYSPGLQEYIEAVSFYQYLKDGQLVSLPAVEKDLVFPRPPPAQQKASVDGDQAITTPGDVSSAAHRASEKPCSGETMSGEEIATTASERNVEQSCPSADEVSDRCEGGDGTIFVTVPPSEFMLGIADLTGELMRTAIMSVAEGDLNYLVQICQFLRIIHDSFTSYGNTAGRELNRKMSALRQSLEKVENACYTLKVRGSEIPKHMLADIFTSSAAGLPAFDDMEDSPMNDD